jgi:hypothetical protein
MSQIIPIAHPSIDRGAKNYRAQQMNSCCGERPFICLLCCRGHPTS